MKFRSLIVCASLAVFLMAPVPADAGWNLQKLCVHSGSDSAGAYDFTPSGAAGAETLTVKIGPTVQAGIRTPATAFWGSTDKMVAVLPIPISNGNAWHTTTDSLGVTMQGSMDASATTPVWVTVGAEQLIDTGAAAPFEEFVAVPFPWVRFIITWNDSESMGGEDTNTLNAYVAWRD